MGFDRPSDLVVMVGIFLIIMTTVGIGIMSVEERQNVTIDSQTQSYITTVNGGVVSVKNTSDDISESLIGQSGSGTEPTEEGIITRSFNSILTIGRSFTVVEENLGALSAMFGIPTSLITIVLAMLLVVFGVVTYSWFRGGAIR